ncbi:phospho-N-acetylmuramoyl-pentapeptide-transferase [Flavobacteriaceae bacterium]|nr:phospho-N-acetylmuramoyl-pentapeptide-transferase [Flavobacteriaceae bacterium]
MQDIITSSLLVFVLAFFSCSLFIKFFLLNKSYITKLIQPIRGDGPESHLINKSNTPTMGGVAIIFSSFISFGICYFFDLLQFNAHLVASLAILLFFFFIGFIDDFLKIKQKSSGGLRGKYKLILQCSFTILVFYLLQINNHLQNATILKIPFLDGGVDLGYLYYLFVILVVVGASNAVNLTDGLDGLVSVPLIINFLSLSIMSYVLLKYNIEQAKWFVMFCFMFIGAILGFLIFNIRPAKIFMGDSGSVPLGAVIGFLAILLKQEIIFAVISSLFVIEASSVMLQVVYYKKTKKRIFLMAPIHHHFEKKGWSEKKVVGYFWLLSLVFALIGLWIFLINKI